MSMQQALLMSASFVPSGSAWYDLVFLPGNVGMAFDFNDLTSLYQDTAGTVPVTTVADPIESVRCQITGALAVLQGSYTCSLAFDAGRSIYYGLVGTTTTGTTPLFRASGSLPAGLLGDSAFSIVAVADWSSSQQALFAHFGAVTPSSGNSGTIGHLNDPGLVLDFIQWGAGRGMQSLAINGVRSAIGTRTARSGGSVTGNIYVDGSVAVSPVNMTASVNVTTQNFDIARITNSGRGIYTVGVINRALTAMEAAAVHAAAL